MAPIYNSAFCAGLLGGLTGAGIIAMLQLPDAIYTRRKKNIIKKIENGDPLNDNQYYFSFMADYVDNMDVYMKL